MHPIITAYLRMAKLKQYPLRDERASEYLALEHFVREIVAEGNG